MRYATFFKFMALAASAAPVLALPVSGEFNAVAAIEARTISAGLSKLPTTLNPLKGIKNAYRAKKDKHEAKMERQRKATAKAGNSKRDVDEEADEAAVDMDEDAMDEGAMDEAATLEARTISAGLSKLPSTLNPLKGIKNAYRAKKDKHEAKMERQRKATAKAGNSKRDLDEEADEAADVEYPSVE